MKRLDSIIVTAFLALLGTTVAGRREALAQVSVNVSADVVVAPPDAYIASISPEYYEGRPVYYYNNYWYYRDAYGRWAYYQDEPVFLRDRRTYWVGRGYDYYRPEYWHDHRGGYSYERHGYQGGYVRGGYQRGGFDHGYRGGFQNRGGSENRGGFQNRGGSENRGGFQNRGGGGARGGMRGGVSGGRFHSHR